MERRLRIELTLSVLVVLAALLGLMFLGTYGVRRAQIDSDADKAIDLIVKNGGSLPENDPDYPDSEVEGFYEMRYLVASVSSSGEVGDVDLSHVATLDEADATELVRRALRHGASRGYVGDYRYRVSGGKGDDRRTVVLLDRARQVEALSDGLSSEMRVYLAGLAGVTLAFVFLSKRIVRPIVSAHESQQRFVVDAGHDLRTPISIISADADVLSMEVGQSEWVDDIKDQVHVMSDLTESLIVLTRASTANERTAGLVDLSEVVAHEVKGFRSRTLTEGHELESKLSPRVFVRGNEQYLARMVGALVDNALKYSAPGGTISVTLGRHLRQAELRVSNPTEGVDPKEVGRWFDRFYQSDRARTHEAGGYGIGLSMVAAVARSHGGRARAEAAPDGGSVTMTVTLPLTRDPLLRDRKGGSHDGA